MIFNTNDGNGVKPIEEGGTGAKTAAQALKNFGINVTAGAINLLSGAKSNIQQQIDDVITQVNGKAAKSHGNHVPTTETANNARFLRNDNTWQAVTPANIGAATSSHTHDGRYYTETETNNLLAGKSDTSHNHDGSYLKRYNLNAINIDSTDGNWTVDIAETGHGTIPDVWVNVTQTTSGHFFIQTAVKCNKDSSAERDAGTVWLRDKYLGSAWSAWTKIHKYSETLPVASGGTGVTQLYSEDSVYYTLSPGVNITGAVRKYGFLGLVTMRASFDVPALPSGSLTTVANASYAPSKTCALIVSCAKKINASINADGSINIRAHEAVPDGTMIYIAGVWMI